ncbi:outer membrane beta-barrel protein [Tardiphaga sp. 813_E8_N1_3]|uniref:outer membrane protein n=1 Tax=Tardiphaga sp. 813_E8_N1_3 TaxID=3240760 RepID=UPI003F295024
MKTFAAAILALALGSVTASAADLPARSYTKAAPLAVPAAYDWSGFYIGANGGGGGGQSCWTLVLIQQNDGCFNVSGGLAGGQIGYNWQWSRAVLGLEVSGDWANLTGSAIPSVGLQRTDHSHVSSIVMATARAGYAWDRSLLYIRGGAAWVHENYSVTCNGTTATGNCRPIGATSRSASETRVSGVVGAGYEYAVTNNLILGIEGDYLPMGTKDVMFESQPGYTCGAGFGQPCSVAVKQDLWTVTGRLSWKFHGPVVAKY